MGRTTQQRVLEMSAELFNRYGIEAVSVGQIAEALEISPGNLTYHYKKKSDLIAEHLNLFEQRLQESVDQFPVLTDAKTFCEASLKLFRLTLVYRFLFIGANYLMQNDLVPVVRYEKLITDTRQRFIRQINHLTAEGHMRPITKPYSIDMLVNGMWWQWLGWLLSMQITPIARRAPESKLVADAVTHIFFLNHHYIDDAFFSAVLAELATIGKKTAPAPTARAAGAS